MRPIFLIFLLIVGYSVVSGQYFIDLEESGRVAKNGIRTKIEWEHSYKDGKLDPKGFKASETTFDRKGNVIEKIAYQYSGAISSKLTSKYDIQYNLIESSRFDGRKNKITQQTFVKFDDRGRKISEEGTSGTASFVNKFKYNNSDDLIGIEYYSDNILTERREIIYLSNKREIKIYSNGTNYAGKIVKTFDLKENLLEEIKYSATNEEQRKFVYKYNSNSKLIEETKYYSGNFREKLVYKLDSTGNIIEIQTTDGEGKTFISNINIYDSKNRLIEEKWYNESKDKFSTKQYTYNSDGDLIQSKCFFANFGTQYVYRYQYTSY